VPADAVAPGRQDGRRPARRHDRARRDAQRHDFWVQRGKDLTQVKTVIGAGGPVAFSADPRRVLSGAVFTVAPNILKPIAPRFYLDEKYILFAIGLLAQSDPVKALRIIRKY
jgi:uncharacterized protein (TIGR01319 family)